MDNNRRKFIKIMLVGSGAVLAEKIFGPLLSKFWSNSLANTKNTHASSDKINFKSFRIAENKKALSIYDGTGEEVLQIDKES